MNLWRSGIGFRMKGAEWEPSYYGTFLLYLFPLYLLPYLKKRYIYHKKFHFFIMAVVLINIIFSFSSAAWLLSPFAFLIISYYIFRYIQEKSINIPVFLLVFVLIFIFTIGISYLMGYGQVIEKAVYKIFFPAKTMSGADRMGLMMEGLSYFFKNPAIGNAFYASGNLYTQFLGSYGLIGFILLMYMFVFIGRRTLIYNNLYKNTLLYDYSIALKASFTLMLLTMMINENLFRLNYYAVFGFILARYRLVSININNKIK